MIDRKAFNKEYWVFLWSSILIALSACLGTVLDAIIVGNLIDEDSVSAINLPLTAADYVHRFVDTIVGFDYFTV